MPSPCKARPPAEGFKAAAMSIPMPQRRPLVGGRARQASTASIVIVKGLVAQGIRSPSSAAATSSRLCGREPDGAGFDEHSSFTA